MNDLVKYEQEKDMGPQKYAGNIITRTREYTPQELKMIEQMLREHPVETTVSMERLLWMDNQMVPGAEMYMECIWLWSGETKSGLMEEPHVHDFEEVIGFISSDPDNPKELGAVMEINLGDEIHYLTQSCLVHIPAGMKHCPLTFKEVRRPVFFFTLAPISQYGRTSGFKNPEAVKKTAFVPPAEADASGTRYGRYIVTRPKSHAPGGNSAERPRPANLRANQIVSLDSEVSPGAFYVDFVWIWSGSMTMSPQPHKHDFDEMIGIAGAGSPGNARRIGGEVSIDIEGEKYQIKESSLVYLPKGIDHCPLEFKDITSPVLCFTIGNTTRWETLKPV
ncbi:MAG TPA: hypothetical protein VLH15_02260 [Dehalococcoidales bacterium]|nr:hypothetical protein [Dehalococcoidales bacterium]